MFKNRIGGKLSCRKCGIKPHKQIDDWKKMDFGWVCPPCFKKFKSYEKLREELGEEDLSEPVCQLILDLERDNKELKDKIKFASKGLNKIIEDYKRR